VQSLVISKGYADCVAYMADDGISLAVAAPEGLTQQDVAVLTDIVLAQTSYTLPQIRIIEVK
jgi:stage III sporulation protein AH